MWDMPCGIYHMVVVNWKAKAEVKVVCWFWETACCLDMRAAYFHFILTYMCIHIQAQCQVMAAPKPSGDQSSNSVAMRGQAGKRNYCSEIKEMIGFFLWNQLLHLTLVGPSCLKNITQDHSDCSPHCYRQSALFDSSLSGGEGNSPVVRLKCWLH